MKTNRQPSRSIIAVAGVIAMSAVVADRRVRPTGSETSLAIDRSTDVRTGSRLYLVLHASGVQKYTCQGERTTRLFTDPEGDALQDDGGFEAVVHHFSTSRPGVPSGESKGAVRLKPRGTQTASGGAGNIAWLLLQAVVTSPGPARTDYVQRLNTTGGVAPAGSCTPGATTAVPYTADYFFWRGPGSPRPAPRPRRAETA